MLRIDAGLSWNLRMREMVPDATGSPVSIYARTMEHKICSFLLLSIVSVLIPVEVSGVYCEAICL
jgi:hypothetical protein